MQLSDTIKEIRFKMKLTQKEFAQKIGATEKRVNNIENGVIKKLVPLEVEALVSLGFNRSWLLAGQGEMFAPDDHQNKLDGLRKMIREKESGNAKTETYVFRPEVYASAGFGYFNENESTELLCVDDRIAQRLGVK
jgi:transcriptional regulator with XRE-family HTH domain